MITVNQVSKRYGRLLAVDDVSVELADAGLTAIIGPNGAGKSTLLGAIGRLLRADAGSIVVGGLDIATAKSRDLARRMAVLRQDNHLPIRLTIEELVGFGRFPHEGTMRSAENQAHVDAALEMLDLVAIRGRHLDEISGGQRQRAFVAMALAQDTDYLLLDEPLNNLDPRHAVDLMGLLRRLVSERGLRVVVVLHDINVAARYADRIIAMRDGRVEHVGTADEVLTTELLCPLYQTGCAVEVLAGRRVVLWD